MYIPEKYEGHVGLVTLKLQKEYLFSLDPLIPYDQSSKMLNDQDYAIAYLYLFIKYGAQSGIWVQRGSQKNMPRLLSFLSDQMVVSLHILESNEQGTHGQVRPQFGFSLPDDKIIDLTSDES